MSQVTHSPNINRSLGHKRSDVLITGKALPKLPVGAMSRSLTILRSVTEAAALYLASYGKANIAEDTYRRLRSMSDVELARLGIERQQIPEYVKRQLF